MEQQAMKRVQRTLVVTCGPFAVEVGARLQDLMSAPGQPAEAVAVVAVSEQPAVSAAALESAVRQVSQTTGREQLAQQGWQLDRLNELAVYLLVDMESVTDAALPAALADQVGAIARWLVGIDAAVQLVALLPIAGTAARATLAQMVTRPACFGRGVIAFSLVDETGLQLADAATLAGLVAQYLDALITTPLRHAPEWLAERQAYAGGESDKVDSAGLAIWRWSPAAARQRLAWQWRQAVLAEWLAEAASDPQEMAGMARSWLDQHGCLPAALMEAVGAWVTPAAVTPWAIPQPWQLRPVIEQLQQHIVPLWEAPPTVVAAVYQSLERALARKEAALRATCRQQLDETPVAGVCRVRRFLQALFQEVDALAEQMLDRQEAQAQQLEALAAESEQLNRQAAALLADWPGADWAAWWPLVWRPWQWPALAWRGWQLQALGQQLTHLAERLARLQQQRIVTAVILAVYDFWQQAQRRLDSQVEEIGQMLTSLQQGAMAETEEPATTTSLSWLSLERLYQQVVESPVLEATQAAALIGGLGEQLERLDDDAVRGPLWQASEARFETAVTLTAAEAVTCLFPDAPELAGWWQRLYEAATPLWRYEAAQAAGLNSLPHTITLVAGANLHTLTQRFKPAETADWRWIEIPDRSRLIVMRLRGGLPVQAG